MIKNISKKSNLSLTYRKLRLSDFKEFSKLFKLCFKKKISYDYFKWRYFSDKFSFCYGVFKSSSLIANVGMKSSLLNNKKKDLIFSRHSSMVLKRYRKLGIFSQLLKKVRKKIFNHSKIIIMWPNKNNFASFGLGPDEIKKKILYLYKIKAVRKKEIKTRDYNIDQLSMYKNFFKNNKSFIFKDLNYFNHRYVSFRHEDYLINKFDLRKLSSFFILKKNKNKGGINYVILDHFGSKIIKSNHLSQLVGEKKNIIFGSKKKIYNLNYKLINHINLIIGLTKKNNLTNKKQDIFYREFMLGDTDSFITIN
jgi:hypothetical protein